MMIQLFWEWLVRILRHRRLPRSTPHYRKADLRRKFSALSDQSDAVIARYARVL